QVPQMERFLTRHGNELAVWRNPIYCHGLTAEILDVELAEFFAGACFPHAHGPIGAMGNELPSIRREGHSEDSSVGREYFVVGLMTDETKRFFPGGEVNPAHNIVTPADSYGFAVRRERQRAYAWDEREAA